MTMLNEEIIKELAKYDELFNGFSYNDIIQEKDEELPEEDPAGPEEPLPPKPEEKSADSSEDEALSKLQLLEAKTPKGLEAMEEKTPEKDPDSAQLQLGAAKSSEKKERTSEKPEEKTNA